MNTATVIDSAAAAADPFFLLSWEWWTEQIVVWIVFTVLVSLVLHILRFCERKPFEGWKLVLLGEDKEGQHQSLHWEEVRRILDSDFERWKLVKSVVAGAGWLSVTRIKPAEEAGWTNYDKVQKQLVIDFNKVPPKHLENGCWRKRPQHLSKDALCQEECPKPGKSTSEGG